jgi:hypothetical protein
MHSPNPGARLVAHPEQPSPPRPARPFSWLPRFRFSLKWLLIAVTVLAVLCALAVLFGGFLDMVVFAVIFSLLPTPLVICAIFARRDVQAFAIGALVPWFTLIVWIQTMWFVSTILYLLFLPLLCGSVAVVTRRWISRFGQ